MKSLIPTGALCFMVLFTTSLSAQGQTGNGNKVVTVTGVRFAYPLLEKWIDDYKEADPNTQIEIVPRSTTDPLQYDLLIEAYEPDGTVQQTRDFVYVARYALIPVANATSDFAKIYSDKGLTRELIEVIYFNDIYADAREAPKLGAEYTVYSRLQNAGAPITFSKYFGFKQSNIKGKTIAGADQDLIKALLKDTTGVSYSVPGLLYNTQTRKQVEGITVIPVDLDDNRLVSDDEKFYGKLDDVIAKLEGENEKEIRNIPIEYISLSISKVNAKPEAIKFLQWVIYNGQESLHQFGFLKPDIKKFEIGKERFEQRALRQK